MSNDPSKQLEQSNKVSILIDKKASKKLQASLIKTSGIPKQETGNKRRKSKQPTSNPLEQKPEKKRVIKAEGKNSKKTVNQPVTGADQRKKERDERAS